MGRAPRKVAIFPRSRGKAVSVESDFAIVHDFDPKVTKELARALRKVVEDEIGGIKIQPSEATIRRRGPGRLFNVTGRLKTGIEIKRHSDGYEIRAPSDRLLIRQIRERLREVAPNLTDPAALMVRARGEMDVEEFLESIVRKKKGWIGRAWGWLKGRF